MSRFKITQKVDLSHLTTRSKNELTQVFKSFVDVGSTNRGRESYYNTKKEQADAAMVVHDALFQIDRGIYGASLLLPGMTDRSRMTGLMNLLNRPRVGSSVLTEEQEARLLVRLTEEIEPQRLLKLFIEMRQNRVNNSRSRKLVLRTIFSSKSLEYWAVKYRRKLHAILEHVLGKRHCGIARAILAKKEVRRSAREEVMLDAWIRKYYQVTLDESGSGLTSSETDEIVSFILGNETKYKLPLLKAYFEAREDLSLGKSLPSMVLEGIRSHYHKNTPALKVLELTRKKLTNREKMQVQKKAQEAGIKVHLDPFQYDPVRLYLYAFEMGMTNQIKDALLEKAEKTASALPLSFDKVGVVVDASASMFGSDSQKLHPMAVALATKDVLLSSGEEKALRYCGGRPDGMLVRPSGDTSLSEALVEVLEEKPDAVFIITDGYENAPAGRLAETVRACREAGIETPIHQVTPVMAAESFGIRRLTDEVPAIPVSKPESIGLNMLTAAFEISAERGVAGLLQLTMEQKEQKKKDRKKARK